MPTPNGEQTLSDILKVAGKGTTDADAGAAIREVVLAAVETGKAGSVTVKVAITPQEDGTVTVAAGVTTSKPRVSPPKSRFFPILEGPSAGALSRHDPEQLRLAYDGRTGEIAD